MMAIKPVRPSAGFTLVELIVSIVMVAILAQIAIAVVMGPFHTFYTIRNNIRAFNIIDSVSDDLCLELEKAAPYSISVGHDGAVLSFRKVIKQFKMPAEELFQSTMTDIEGALHPTDNAVVAVYFKDFPQLGIQVVNIVDNQIDFKNHPIYERRGELDNFRFDVLTAPLEYRFVSLTKNLFKVQALSSGQATQQALLGHLAYCHFLWDPVEQLLSIQLQVASDKNTSYRFKQQVALY